MSYYWPLRIFVINVVMQGLVIKTNWEKADLGVAGPTAIAINSRIDG